MCFLKVPSLFDLHLSICARVWVRARKGNKKETPAMDPRIDIWKSTFFSHFLPFSYCIYDKARLVTYLERQHISEAIT
jgi:hypothetical protein